VHLFNRALLPSPTTAAPIKSLGATVSVACTSAHYAHGLLAAECPPSSLSKCHFDVLGTAIASSQLLFVEAGLVLRFESAQWAVFSLIAFVLCST
jgi:hypothetical protein